MSGPTMLESLDKYYDTNRMYDLKIISNLGLEDADIEEIQKLNKEYTVMGSHTKDAIFNDGKHETVLRMHEISEGMNNILLLKGRMPEKYNEIVVEDGIAYKTGYDIGDKIKLELDEDDTSIKTDELEIVGFVRSPEYLNNAQITQSRGNTSIGTGQVAYYSYVSKDLFNLDYYTEIYILDNDATKYKTTTKEYLKRIKKDEKQLNKIKEAREKYRYTKLLNEANKKLQEEMEKANNELNTAQKKLEQSKAELDNGKIELENARIKLYNSKIELDNAKRELDSANAEIQQNYKLLEKSKEELTQAKQKLDNGKKEIEDKLKEIEDYEITYDKLADFVKKYDSSSFSIDDIVKLFTNDDINIKETIKDSLVNIKLVASSYGINLEEMFNQYGINEQELLEKVDLKLNEILDVVTIEQLKKMILDENFIILIKESIPEDFAYYDTIETYLEGFSSNKSDIIKLFEGIREIEKGYPEYNKNLKLVNENEVALNNVYKQYQDGVTKYNLGISEYEAGNRRYNLGLNEYNTNTELYFAIPFLYSLDALFNSSSFSFINFKFL